MDRAVQTLKETNGAFSVVQWEHLMYSWPSKRENKISGNTKNLNNGTSIKGLSKEVIEVPLYI